MWGGQSMTIIDSMMLSAMGVIVVFAALAIVAIILVITSRKSEEAAVEAPMAAPVTAAAAAATGASAPAPAPEPGLDEEAYAVLMAAITEEARLSGEGEIRVLSIRELD